jgi:hypothetical protein
MATLEVLRESGLSLPPASEIVESVALKLASKVRSTARNEVGPGVRFAKGLAIYKIYIKKFKYPKLFIHLQYSL